MRIKNINNIEALCKQHGADLIGIAPVERFTEAPEGFSPSDVLSSCKSVIILLCEFPKDAIEKSTREYTDIRNNMVEKMDHMAENISQIIRENGEEAIPIPSVSGCKWNNGRARAAISLKHAAVLAGLGKIGRNYLLTNDKYGNLLWLSGIVTSAEFSPSPLVDYIICQKCNQCVDNCPSSALDNELLFGQRECYDTCYILTDSVLELKCFNCRKVCPARYGIHSFS